MVVVLALLAAWAYAALLPDGAQWYGYPTFGVTMAAAATVGRRVVPAAVATALLGAAWVGTPMVPTAGLALGEAVVAVGATRAILAHEGPWRTGLPAFVARAAAIQAVAAGVAALLAVLVAAAVGDAAPSPGTWAPHAVARLVGSFLLLPTTRYLVRDQVPGLGRRNGAVVGGLTLAAVVLGLVGPSSALAMEVGVTLYAACLVAVAVVGGLAWALLATATATAVLGVRARLVELDVAAVDAALLTTLVIVAVAGVGALVDLRRQRMRELAVARDRLRHFARLASHDLRQPLAAIAGMADTLHLRGDLLAPEVRDELLARIAATSRAMAGQLDDLLAVAGTRDDVVLSVDDLRTWLHDLVGGELAAVGGVVRWHGHAGATHGVDGAVLRIALHTLVANALRYRRPDRTPRIDVTVGLDAVARLLRVEVADNGRGLASGDHERVFDGHRAHRDVVGSGLGLRTTRELVEATGGSLTVRRRPEGHGATFDLVLPLGRGDGHPSLVDHGRAGGVVR